MKIQIEKKELFQLISKAQNIVEKRNTMPILVNVLVEARKDSLKIFATNLEVSLTAQSPAKVISVGRVAVNAKSMFDIIKELPEGPVTLERLDNNWLKIVQNKSVFNIVGISPEEYPVFPTFSTNEFATIDGDILAEMIEKTIHSVSNDEARYHLNGVYFQKNQEGEQTSYRMVATDGHRLSLINRLISDSKPGAESSGVIIPRKGMNEIRKLLDDVENTVDMAIEGAQLIVRHGETLLMIRLIEGKYPNYKKLIPNNLSEKAHMKREPLLASLKRVSLLSNQKSRGVTFSLSPGKMEITSNNPDLGDAKEEIEIDYEGASLKIGFNSKYLLDVLTAIDDEEVLFEFKDQLSPGLLRPESDSNYTSIIMPMRI